MGIRCFLCPPHTIFETALAGPSLSKIQLAAGGAGFASSNAHVSKNKCAVMQPIITYFACSGWWNLRKPKDIMALGGVKSMKPQKNNIARNLTTLRQLNKYSQEDVAEQIGVSRQAVAKWEAGKRLHLAIQRFHQALLAKSKRGGKCHIDMRVKALCIPYGQPCALQRALHHTLKVQQRDICRFASFGKPHPNGSQSKPSPTGYLRRSPHTRGCTAVWCAPASPFRTRG